MSATARVLFVLDDDSVMRTLVCRIAERNGFVASGYSTPVGFLEACETEPPDLILLDLAMGEQDGIAVLQALASRRCQVPVIVSSGLDERLLTSAVRVGRGLGLSMLAPLRKPVSPGDIAGALVSAAATVLPIRDQDFGMALEAGQLVPYYQPKIRLVDRVIVGAEALVRWEHPMRGVLGPAAFLKLAEDGPGIAPLTAMMVERAARDCAAWREAGQDVGIAINISARCLTDSGFADRVADTVARTGLGAASVTLEVTETAAMADTAMAAAALTRLRIRGFSLSMDDFGTGYSSLAELHRMPFSELKIDRSFVSGISYDRDAIVITRAVIALGKALGMQTVAEGVENEQQLSMVAEAGCDYAQGYLIGRPMTAQAFAALMARNGGAGEARLTAAA